MFFENVIQIILISIDDGNCSHCGFLLYESLVIWVWKFDFDGPVKYALFYGVPSLIYTQW